MKAPCTRHQDHRRMTRWAYEDGGERMQQRLEHHPAMRLKRQAMVEQPFGTIQRWMDQGDFLMRGKKKVSTAMRVSLLAYHIKRVLNSLGGKTMSAALP